MPPLKLTPQLVRSLGQAGVRSEHRDSVVPGLVLRVGATGGKTWSYYYSLRGRNHRITLGSVDVLDLPAARARAKAEALKVASGRNPAAEKRAARTRADHTVGSLVADMLERVRLRPSTEKEWRRLAAVELAPIAERPADELTRGEVRDLLDRIRQRSGWTANHVHQVGRRAYSWAMSLEMVLSNPWAGIPKPYEGEASERVLSTPEVRALWRALDVLGEGQYPDAVRLLLLTGVRRAMVLGARRGEFAIPIETTSNAVAIWTIPGGFSGRSKSGRAHVVPLSPQALAVVRRRLEAGGDLLFPALEKAGKKPMIMSSRFVRTLKAAVIWQLRRELGHGLRAKMAPWHLHNLRHTIGTHMTDDLGVHFDVVSMILGHAVSGPRVSRVYNRAERLPERRAALALWGAWVEGLAAERSNVLPMAGKRGEK